MKQLRILLVLVLGLAFAPLWALTPSVSDAELVPTPAQKQATRLITRLMTKHHYRKVPLDNHLSAQILERYLEALDPNRSFFVARDVEDFRAYEKRLDDFLRYARLEPAFEIFRLFRYRHQERMSYAIALLDRGFNFNIDESYVADRSEAPWPRDRKELDDIWRKRVKNDVLSLRLAGKTDEEIKETLRKRYENMARRTRQLTAEDVFQVFMNAYTNSVEPHTSYFSPHTQDNFKISMSLSLEGIGAALQNEDEYTVVKKIITGGPADRSDALHPDDRIIGVGQGDEPIVDVVGWRLDDVVDLIRGPKGSQVRLRILPKSSGTDGPGQVLTLTRDTIKLEEQAAKSSVIDIPGAAGTLHIGVIDLPTFYMDFAARARGDEDYRSTSRDVRRLILELKQQGIDGLVIDLRGNSGGSLAEATELTGLFIPSGPVVQVKDSGGSVDLEEDPNPDIAYDGPLAVLTDRYSASASEIFSGAIQDYKRGIVIGEPTYGKGTVQTLVNLDRYSRDKDARLGQLKLTIAQFFRISGDSTQNRGVVPDIVYPTAFDIDEHGERSLDNALPWAKIKPADYHAWRLSPSSIERLKGANRQRIDKDPGFAYLLDEAQLQKQLRDRAGLTLLESRRGAERKAREQSLRESENRYRTAQGLPPISEEEAKQRDADAEAGKDDEDEDEPDPTRALLDEAAHILADYIRADARTSEPRWAKVGETSAKPAVH
jgi:carboxyl-terminal processing protease